MIEQIHSDAQGGNEKAATFWGKLVKAQNILGKEEGGKFFVGRDLSQHQVGAYLDRMGEGEGAQKLKESFATGYGEALQKQQVAEDIMFKAIIAVAGVASAARVMGSMGETTAASGAKPTHKTVGRWMSPDELAKMKDKGVVQEGGGGQTRVADPANPNAYKAAPKGDVYVEFDVPANRVKPHSKGTGRIPGMKSPDARAAARKGRDTSFF